MKDIVSKMLAHPFASCLIIGAVTGGVANIIRAARGVENRPFVELKKVPERPEEEKFKAYDVPVCEDEVAE